MGHKLKRGQSSMRWFKQLKLMALALVIYFTATQNLRPLRTGTCGEITLRKSGSTSWWFLSKMHLLHVVQSKNNWRRCSPFFEYIHHNMKHLRIVLHRFQVIQMFHTYIYMSPDSGSLGPPPNGMVPQAHALGNTGHGTIHTYMHACMHPCIHPSIHTYIHTDTHTQTDIHTYVSTYLPTYQHTYVPTYLHTHAQPTYTRTYIHTYLPTYIHTYIT